MSADGAILCAATWWRPCVSASTVRRGWRHYVRNWRGLTRRPPTTPSGPASWLPGKRYGRYLSRGPGGRLAIDAAAVRRAARMDGKYVLLTNDDTLSPEDVGLGYKAMMIEACFRRMKTTGLRIRPVYHWTAHRITSHIRLCVLALLLERAAEIRVGDTWRNLRFALEEVKAVRYRVHGLTLVQSTRLTAQVLAYLKKARREAPSACSFHRKFVCTLLQYLDTRVERPVCNALTFYAVPHCAYYGLTRVPETVPQCSGHHSGGICPVFQRDRGLRGGINVQLVLARGWINGGRLSGASG